MAKRPANAGFVFSTDRGTVSPQAVWVGRNREPNPGIAAAIPGVAAPLSLIESFNALILASQRPVGHKRGDHGDALRRYVGFARYQMFPAPGV
jgi:hypothetical protein